MTDKLRDGFRVVVFPTDLLYLDNLNAYEKLVFIVLRSFANSHEDTVFPSENTIARLASISRSTVKRALHGLEAKGLITRSSNYEYDPNTKRARQTSNTYTLQTMNLLSMAAGADTVPPPGSHRTPPRSCENRPPVLTELPPRSCENRQEQNHIEQNHRNINDDDDDKDRIINQIFEAISIYPIKRDDYDKVVRRVLSTPVTNFKQALKRAVAREYIRMHIKMTDYPAMGYPEPTQEEMRRWEDDFIRKELGHI